MSVLIKGMNKPTACYKCQLKTGKYCGILTENEKCAEDGVLPNCPIVEAPEPHGRLIDADALWYGYPRYYGINSDEDIDIISREDIDKAPTVIESEANSERVNSR